VAISFLQPWFLLLVIPAAALLWRYNGSYRYSREGRPLVLLARALFFLLIIFSLARPHLVKTFTGQSVIYLLDRSRSVEAGPDYTAWINESLGRLGPDDRAAVMAFARDTRLLKPYGMEKLPAAAAAVDGNHTSLEGALRMAYSLIPADSAGRIVLISDGLENSGDALSFARALAARNIAIDVLPVAVETGDEVAVRDIELPRNTHPGQQLLVEVELQSTVNTAGLLSLFWEGTPVFRGEVTLTAGVQRFSIPVAVAGQGFQRVQALIEPQRDTWVQNNSIEGLTNVQAPPRVLVVERTPGKGAAVAGVLQGQAIDVHVVSPDRLPASPAGLALYRAVYLVDVPAYRLTAEQQQNLELFVRVLGGGLVAIGGKHSFGLGLYQDTPLEALLPVTMEVENREELPGLDMVLVIDRSGSMEGEKLNMAKNAALVSLEVLKERDRLAVITFDDRFYVDLPLTSPGDQEAIGRVITGISIGGGTIIFPALEKAVELLEGSTRSRHIVLLSDGMEGTAFNYLPLLEKAGALGVTITAIALGSDADQKHMQFLADKGGGRYYFVPRSADLPGIFLQETVMAGGDYLVEEDFTPSVTHPFAARLAGSMPVFNGYVAGTLKPLAEQILQTHLDHPLLSRWQYGLGRSMAFTSDSWGMWTGEFLQHPGFGGFWADTLAWVVPQSGEGGLALDVRLEDGGAVIEALLRREPPGEVETVTVTVIDAAARQFALELKPTGGGRYGARLEEVSQGVYLLSATLQRDGAAAGHAVSGFAVPYSPEFRIPSQSGLELLAALSGQTGGRILKHPREVFAAPPEPVRRSTEITRWLLLAAAALWPLDIAFRRFGVAVGAPALKKKPARPAAPESETPAAGPALERLLAAKKKK
jgi:Mg-chelatase subunit ChlD